MVKIGIHDSYASTDRDVDYPALIEKIRRMGYDVLEADPVVFLTMPRHRRQEIRKLAEDLGVALVFSLRLPPEYDLSSPDESVRTNGIRYSIDILKTVAQMGGRMVGGCLYACWPYRHDGNDREKLVDTSVKSVRECVKVAEDFEIDYGLEVFNRFEHAIMNTAREAVDFIKRVDSPRTKIVLDTFHMNIEEPAFEDAIRTADGYLANIHLAENDRRFPGMGTMPWARIFGALKEIEYNGTAVIKPFMLTGGEVGTGACLWRDLTNSASLQKLDEMAKESLGFVRALINS
jgi:D-psicose/D-tagatose/L-ribulose 3-epimerase